MATLAELAALARRYTLQGSGGEEGYARRAFELAHQVRRLIERAAEHASRDRWRELEAPTGKGRSMAEQFAAQCVAGPYPIRGEAAVYAALLTAADLARQVSDALYSDWLARLPKAQRQTDYIGPRDRISGPMAEGCKWNRPPDEED